MERKLKVYFNFRFKVKLFVSGSRDVLEQTLLKNKTFGNLCWSCFGQKKIKKNMDSRERAAVRYSIRKPVQKHLDSGRW